MSVIGKVISGGQTGVDQAALRAAQQCYIPTGGTAPQGWKTEDGPRPTLAAMGLIECSEPGYVARTIQNVKDADATLIIAPVRMGTGSQLTHTMCYRLRKPVTHWCCEDLYMRVFSMNPGVRDLIQWLVNRWIGQDKRPLVLNVAGTRESHRPGVYDESLAFLTDLFRAVQRRT